MSVQFGSVAPLLDARLEGKHFTCATGTSTHYYNFSHEAGIDSIKFNGVETYSNGTIGDYVTLWTEYTIDGGTTWKRYKKFGKNYMVFPNEGQKNILFPTTPTNGVRLVIQYENTGGSSCDLLINLFNFVDQRTVNVGIAEEGIDW